MLAASIVFIYRSDEMKAWRYAGGTLLGVAVLGAAMLLTSKPKHDAWPGVLALLSDVSGHPKVVIAAQIETILTSVLS